MGENIHYLEQPMMGIFTACYLIVGKKMTLVDSGLPETYAKVILPYLRKIGRSPEDIHLIVHTHSHADHVGSDQAIKQVSEARTAIHEAGVEVLENPKESFDKYLAEYGKYLGTSERENVLGRAFPASLKVDQVLRDGDILDVGDTRLEVTHTPGHTPDSVCFHNRSSGIIFTGDSVQGGSTMINDFVIVQDPDAYVRSIDRLLKMDLRLMLMDHPYLPRQTAVLEESHVKEYLRYSRDIDASIMSQTLEILKKASRPLSAAEVSYLICPIFRRVICEGVTDRTVLAYLQRLSRQGKIVETLGPRNLVLWSTKD